MTNQQVIELIEKEFKQNTLGVTEQYLRIHSPIYIDTTLRVDRIDHTREDEMIVAYLPVSKEKFYFAVYIDKKKNEITGMGTEGCYKVYFRAISDTIALDEIKAMTLLAPTESWNKGDLRQNAISNHSFSSFEIFPNPEPDDFENKLKKLLDLLEQDIEGIKQLADKTESSIQVAMYIHNANGMIGGHTIDSNDIRRMNDLKLSIKFDLYVSGKSIEE